MRRLGLWAFAVEDTTVQLTWHHLEGPARLEVGDHDLVVEGHGPGALVLGGLQPGSRYAARMQPRSGPARLVEFRTLPPLRGPELCRVATISDLHVGTPGFDLANRMVEALDSDALPHPERCARAAAAAAEAWGARHLVIKGDITDKGTPEQWDAFGEALSAVTVPVTAIPGNHDVKPRPERIPPGEGAARIGLDLVESVGSTDLPGIRLILVSTAIEEQRHGTLLAERVTEALDLAADAADGVLVVLHHHLEWAPLTWFWPPGIGRREGNDFLTRLGRANRRALVTSGHTHRHRRRLVGGVVATEVGSAKDYPGTWAGYAVHEDGIRQVVRRVDDPGCLPWLERTGRAALGTWGRWSPGRLSSRCFAHRWDA